MPSFIESIAVFIVVLAALVVIHEFGHFIVARMFGVRVEVFSVGFGHRLAGIKRGHTDYRLSLIPLGGYVKLAGEAPDSTLTGAPHEFCSKPKWQRFLIAAAGPLMNVALALAVPALLAMVYHNAPAYLARPALVHAVDPDSPAEEAGIRRGDIILEVDGSSIDDWGALQDVVKINPGHTLALTIEREGDRLSVALTVGLEPYDEQQLGYSGLRPDVGGEARLIIKSVADGSPAERAGLRAGDRLVAVNGQVIEQSFHGRSQAVGAIRGSGGREITVTVERDGSLFDMAATPRLEQGVARIGIQQSLVGIEMASARLNAVEAINHSIDSNLRILDLTTTVVGQVVTGRRTPRDAFAGPIQIFKYSGQAAEEGAPTVLRFMSILSLNLGVFNLLPIPALDGGLMLMLALEGLLGLFGVPLTLRMKERMMRVGFVTLMLLMTFALVNDLARAIDPLPGPHASERAPPPRNK